MINMPQMVAALHSFVGAAATIVGFAEFTKMEHFAEAADGIKNCEIWVAIFIGAVTLSGSIVAWGKLDGKIKSEPLILWGWFRHVLNGVIVFLILLWGIIFIYTF
jgi:NAD(P) transhydrogenase subunit beta